MCVKKSSNKQFLNKRHMFTGSSSTNWKNKLLYFEWSPPWHLFVIVSDISSGNIDGTIFWHSILAFHLAFYLNLSESIWHSILAFYLASIEKSYLASFVASVLAFSLAFYLACFLPYVLAYVLTFNSTILSSMLVWHSIWHLFWHSFLAFYLLYGWEHSDPELAVRDLALAVEVRREHSDPELAVRVRRGTLRSSACSWGPAGNTLILSLFGSGREHCDLADLALAVEVRRETLWSWACCSGPAGNTAI